MLCDVHIMANCCSFMFCASKIHAFSHCFNDRRDFCSKILNISHLFWYFHIFFLNIFLTFCAFNFFLLVRNISQFWILNIHRSFFFLYISQFGFCPHWHKNILRFLFCRKIRQIGRWKDTVQLYFALLNEKWSFSTINLIWVFFFNIIFIHVSNQSSNLFLVRSTC